MGRKSKLLLSVRLKKINFQSRGDKNPKCNPTKSRKLMLIYDWVVSEVSLIVTLSVMRTGSETADEI